MLDFIFSTGIWLGEGKITFSSSTEFIKFYTKWEIIEEDHETKATQIVEMIGVNEHITNFFTFKNFTEGSFTVVLNNDIIGTISGTGLRNESKIAWEFRGDLTFEGFEVYEQQENGDYFFHAEYGSLEQYRTIIEGLIWRKGS